MLGEEQRANDMLDGALAVIEARPRLGTGGFWVNDARIHAIRQRPDEALHALRTAADSGWRFQTWYHLEFDPNLESIRGTPEFAAIDAAVKADLAAQAERVRELEASGELGAMAGRPGLSIPAPLAAAGGAGRL